MDKELKEQDEHKPSHRRHNHSESQDNPENRSNAPGPSRKTDKKKKIKTIAQNIIEEMLATYKTRKTKPNSKKHEGSSHHKTSKSNQKKKHHGKHQRLIQHHDQTVGPLKTSKCSKVSQQKSDSKDYTEVIPEEIPYSLYTAAASYDDQHKLNQEKQKPLKRKTGKQIQSPSSKISPFNATIGGTLMSPTILSEHQAKRKKCSKRQNNSATLTPISTAFLDDTPEPDQTTATPKHHTHRNTPPTTTTKLCSKKLLSAGSNDRKILKSAVQAKDRFVSPILTGGDAPKKPKHHTHKKTTVEGLPKSVVLDRDHRKPRQKYKRRLEETAALHDTKLLDYSDMGSFQSAKSTSQVENYSQITNTRQRSKPVKAMESSNSKKICSKRQRESKRKIADRGTGDQLSRAHSKLEEVNTIRPDSKDVPPENVMVIYKAEEDHSPVKTPARRLDHSEQPYSVSVNIKTSNASLEDDKYDVGNRQKQLLSSPGHDINKSYQTRQDRTRVHVFTECSKMLKNGGRFYGSTEINIDTPAYVRTQISASERVVTSEEPQATLEFEMSTRADVSSAPIPPSESEIPNGSILSAPPRQVSVACKSETLIKPREATNKNIPDNRAVLPVETRLVAKDDTNTRKTTDTRKISKLDDDSKTTTRKSATNQESTITKSESKTRDQSLINAKQTKVPPPVVDSPNKHSKNITKEIEANVDSRRKSSATNEESTLTQSESKTRDHSLINAKQTKVPPPVVDSPNKHSKNITKEVEANVDSRRKSSAIPSFKTAPRQSTTHTPKADRKQSDAKEMLKNDPKKDEKKERTLDDAEPLTHDTTPDKAESEKEMSKSTRSSLGETNRRLSELSHVIEHRSRTPENKRYSLEKEQQKPIKKQLSMPAITERLDSDSNAYYDAQSKQESLKSPATKKSENKIDSEHHYHYQNINREKSFSPQEHPKRHHRHLKHSSCKADEYFIEDSPPEDRYFGELHSGKTLSPEAELSLGLKKKKPFKVFKSPSTDVVLENPQSNYFNAQRLPFDESKISAQPSPSATLHKLTPSPSKTLKKKRSPRQGKSTSASPKTDKDKYKSTISKESYVPDPYANVPTVLTAPEQKSQPLSRESPEKSTVIPPYIHPGSLDQHNEPQQSYIPENQKYYEPPVDSTTAPSFPTTTTTQPTHPIDSTYSKINDSRQIAKTDTAPLVSSSTSATRTTKSSTPVSSSKTKTQKHSSARRTTSTSNSKRSSKPIPAMPASDQHTAQAHSDQAPKLKLRSSETNWSKIAKNLSSEGETAKTLIVAEPTKKQSTAAIGVKKKADILLDNVESKKAPPMARPIGSEAYVDSKRRTSLTPILLLLLNIIALLLLLLASYQGWLNGFIIILVEEHVPPELYNIRPVCDSIHCGVAGTTLFYTINYTADPCKDPVEYICGNWIHQPPEKYMKIVLGAENRFLENVFREIRRMLEDPSLLPSGPATFRKIASFYQKCNNLEGRNRDGLGPLKKLLETYHLQNWPLANTNEIVNPLSVLAKFIRDSGSGTLVSVRIVPDPSYITKSRNKIIALDCSTFTLPLRIISDLKSEEDIFKKYTDHISKAISKYTGTNVDKNVVKNIIAFEANTAHRCNKDCRRKKLRTLKIEELDATSHNQKNVSWLQFLQTVMEGTQYEVSPSTIISVRSSSYLRKISAVLSSSDGMVRATNYIGWRILNHFMRFSTEDMWKMYSQLYETDLGYMKLELWKRCIIDINAVMPLGMGRLYADYMLWRSSDYQVHKLVFKLIQSLDVMFWQFRWIEGNSFDEAQNTLVSAGILVGYPPWIQSNHALDDYYAHVPEEGNYLWLIWNTMQVYTLGYLKEIHLAVYTKRLFNFILPYKSVEFMHKTGPPREHLLYDIRYNQFVVPSGVFQPPYYTSEAVASINFGGLGILIGLDLITEFFKSPDATWINKEVRTQLDNHQACFQQEIEKQSGTALPEGLCGALTVYALTLRLAYGGFHNFLENNDEGTIPNLEIHSPDELYFLTSIRSICTRIREKHYKDVVTLRQRVDELKHFGALLLSLNEYVDAFKCPTKQRKNVLETCMFRRDPASPGDVDRAGAEAGRGITVTLPKYSTTPRKRQTITTRHYSKRQHHLRTQKTASKKKTSRTSVETTKLPTRAQVTARIRNFSASHYALYTLKDFYPQRGRKAQHLPSKNLLSTQYALRKRLEHLNHKTKPPWYYKKRHHSLLLSSLQTRQYRSTGQALSPGNRSTRPAIIEDYYRELERDRERRRIETIRRSTTKRDTFYDIVNIRRATQKMHRSDKTTNDDSESMDFVDDFYDNLFGDTKSGKLHPPLNHRMRRNRKKRLDS